MTTASTTAPVLVIGATGKTGRRVARLLAERGHAVRPGTRAATIPFDWDRSATWAPALDGVRAAYITYYPDLAVPGAVERIGALTEAARAAGVGRLVLLSGRGEAHVQACERIVAAGGLAHTLVRCAWFAQNFSEGVLREAVMAGTLALPAGAVAEPVVDADDIAEVAASALVDEGHDGALYKVTGPDLLGFAEIADRLAAATGRPMCYEPISLDAFRAAMAETAGPTMAEVLAEIARETLDGRNAWLGDGVHRALGRPPRSFVAFCEEAARGGAWRMAA